MVNLAFKIFYYDTMQVTGNMVCVVLVQYMCGLDSGEAKLVELQLHEL